MIPVSSYSIGISMIDWTNEKPIKPNHVNNMNQAQLCILKTGTFYSKRNWIKTPIAKKIPVYTKWSKDK